MSAKKYLMELANMSDEGYEQIRQEERQRLIDNPMSPINLDKNIVLLQEENAGLWYDVMLKDVKIESQETEIADLWYELMMGGMQGVV